MKIKQAVLFCLTTCIIAIAIYACSKSSGYGNNNGNNNGTGNSVSIKNFAFSVNSLTVSAGTKVTWTNNDATTHTVTADDGSFDSGNIAPGGSFSKTFSTAGAYAYHCSIHSTMKAKVEVE